MDHTRKELSVLESCFPDRLRVRFTLTQEARQWTTTGRFLEWSAVYMRFKRERGAWMELWQAVVRPGAGGTNKLFVDSTIVRAHSHAAGGGDGDEAKGRSRGGINAFARVMHDLTEKQAHEAETKRADGLASRPASTGTVLLRPPLRQTVRLRRAT